MKIIVENTKSGITVNLDGVEENAVVAFTDIVALLEYAKQLVVSDWNRAIQAQNEEQQKEVETQ